MYYPIKCPACGENNGDNVERLRVWYFQQWSYPDENYIDQVYRVDFQCWSCHRCFSIKECSEEDVRNLT